MDSNWTVTTSYGAGAAPEQHTVGNVSHALYDAGMGNNGMELYCDNVTLTCTYTNPMNLTDFLLPRTECRYEMALYLYCSSDWTSITESVNGYVSPALVFFTVITNILMSVVLLKKNMRNPTNILLVAMALSDMFTGVLPVPFFLYFYTMKHYKDFVPYDWCFAHEVMTQYLPTIFHTASIWLTVALAVQRYICVCHSLKAKRWCTIPNVVKVIVGIYIAAALSQCTRFFENEYTHVTAQSLRDPTVFIDSCFSTHSKFLQMSGDSYYYSYYLIRVIFIHLIPCTSLVVLNAMLIGAMRSAQRRREQLLKQNRRSECRRLKESNCTTLMLVTVVGLFLLVEFPMAILMILVIFENTLDVVLIQDENKNMTSIIVNLIILLSYPLNFFIYCGMSRHFRETFCRLFRPGATPVDRENSQYMSLATENGGGKHSVGCNTKDTVL